MALSGNRLGDAIRVAVDAVTAGAGGVISPDVIRDVWRAVGNEIINEFKNNGVIKPDTMIIDASAVGSTLARDPSGAGNDIIGTNPITGTGKIE